MKKTSKKFLYRQQLSKSEKLLRKIDTMDTISFNKLMSIIDRMLEENIQ